MMDSVLELKLTEPRDIALGGAVTFNEQSLYPAGIEYSDSDGIITFNKIGQYSIKWWVATETILRGTIKFELQPSHGSFTSGCSPIKTGQVSGFGVLDVETIGTTLSLVNQSTTDMVCSKKTTAKAYLLVTPIGTASTRVYRGNLSASGSAIQVPLGNGLYYRLENLNATELRSVLTPMNGNTRYDYRRLSAFDGVTGMEGNTLDNTQLTAPRIVDTPIYNNSREMYWALIRVQNPISTLWSTYEIRFFASNGITRVTLWVNVIEEEVSY